MLFSLSAHLTTPSLCAPLLHTPQADHLSYVLCVSAAIALIFQVLLASVSYLTFASRTPDDILVARPGNPAYLLAQLAIVIVNVASFPMVLMPIYSLLDWAGRALSEKRSNRSYRHLSLDPAAPDPETDGRPPPRNPLLGLAIIVLGLLVSSFFTRLGEIFDVIGSMTTGILFVALPAVFFISTGPGSAPRRALLLAALGFLLTLVSTVALFL
jgi:amino acid permease